MKLCVGLFLCVSTLMATSAVAQEPTIVARLRPPPSPHIRVLTWNVGSNSIFVDPGPGRGSDLDGQRPAQFARIMRALRPHVVCLQEIHLPRTADDVAALLDTILPMSGGGWQTYGVRDVVIATPFRLSLQAARQEDFGNGPRTHVMALVTAPTDSLYVVCAHMQSRGTPADIASRQRQADVIMQGLREVRLPGPVRACQEITD